MSTLLISSSPQVDTKIAQEQKGNVPNVFPLITAVGILTVLGSSLNAFYQSYNPAPQNQAAISAQVLIGGTLALVGALGESMQWREVKLPAKNITSNCLAVCQNVIANTFYSVGRALDKPFFHQFDVAAQWIFQKPSLEDDSENASILERVGLVSGIAPAVTGMMASAGFLLSAMGALGRMPASIFCNESIPAKVWNGSDPLEVMTYNICFMPNDFFRTFSKTRPNIDRATEIADFLSRQEENFPDILCLQEGFEDLTLLNKVGKIYRHAIYSVAPREWGKNSGLMILTNFNIDDLHFTAFKVAAGFERGVNKGLLGVTLDAGNGHKIRVYNSHLQSTCEKVRQAQMLHIKNRVIEECKDQNYDAVILAGDFNQSYYGEDGSDSQEYANTKKMLGPDFVNLFYEDHNSDGTRNRGEAYYEDVCEMEPTSTWYPKDDADSTWGTINWQQETSPPGCVLDHIFTYKTAVNSENSTTQIRCVEPLGKHTSGTSDHHPLSAHLTLI